MNYGRVHFGTLAPEFKDETERLIGLVSESNRWPKWYIYTIGCKCLYNYKGEIMPLRTVLPSNVYMVKPFKAMEYYEDAIRNLKNAKSEQVASALLINTAEKFQNGISQQWINQFLHNPDFRKRTPTSGEIFIWCCYDTKWWFCCW